MGEGGSVRGGGGDPKVVVGGGGLRATRYYHMDTSGGDVCWMFGGTEVCM